MTTETFAPLGKAADPFARPDLFALVPRDRFGRPLVFLPDGSGKTTAYTRASTVGKAIEDTYHLSLWQQRQVLRGAQVAPALLLEVEAVGSEPNRDDEKAYKAWKEALDALVQRAHDAIGSHSRADAGTYMHAVFEASDAGLPESEWPAIPDHLAAAITVESRAQDVAARAVATSGWRWLCREKFVVNDDWEIAGTLDGLALAPDLATPDHWLIKIIDDKTGRSMDFVGLGYCAQVATYAQSRLYELLDGSRSDFTTLLPPDIDPVTVRLDTNLAVIVHTPVGEGRCDIYEVPLEQGRAAVALATDVRAMRTQSKRWLKLVGRHGAPPSASTPAATRPSKSKGKAASTVSDPVDRLADEIAAATSIDELLAIRDKGLVAQFSNSGNAWTPWQPHHEELAAARAAVLNTPAKAADVDPVMQQIWSASTLDDLTAVWSSVVDFGGNWTDAHDEAARAKAAQIQRGAA